MKQNIYVEPCHDNFWWGIYKFTTTTDWEDLIFYERKNDVFERIGSVCVCSRKYLENGLADLADDPREKSFVEAIKQFIQSNVLTYQYWYDEPEDQDFYEVSFDAERNEKGAKPRYIEMWYPGDGIDMHAVETCTIAFCEKFLSKRVNAVFLKEILPFEQAANGYREYISRQGNSPAQIVFTDDLVESLEKLWRMPKEEVRRNLLRSI